ncbi:MAG TPA: hypothetical protein VJ226_00875 [Bradyrhizobium sp.]|nr:hypothetical protein [Bradyrhizobium sp.]
MADDRPEDVESAADPARARREPPTIDLEASEVISEVKGEPQHAGGEAEPERQPEAGSATPDSEPVARPVSKPISEPISPWIIAPLSGLVAASLVIAVGWMLGWPAVQPATPAAPPVNAAAIDGLAARLASVESKAGKPAAAASDPAAAARLDALEKSLAALRGDVERARAQSDKLAAELGNVKATPGGTASAPDLTAIDDRLDQLERASKAASAEIAKETASTAEVKAAEAKPADDLPLRRVVAASLLDISVRQSEPYVAALAAAKSLSPDADALKPLDGFAASGIPGPNALCRELLTLVPKLSPPAEASATTGSGIVERLEAGASKLVKIERTDVSGSDRGAIVARVMAAALRNDLAETRREVNTLAPADRAAAQAWIDKANARDAALAASRQFADQAMADLAKPGQ